MAKRDNFFALLGDDDEGVDLMTLVARAEAKAAIAPAVAIPAAATDGVATKQSQRASADQGRMEREKGKGGHYQLGFTRAYHGNSAGRGGRGRGRGVGSRGRGRGFYVVRTFGNESHFYNTQNQGQTGDVKEDVTEEKDSEYRSKRLTRYEKGDGKIGDENQNSGFLENQGFRFVERRNYGGSNRPFGAGRASGGNRGFRGGEYRDENGYAENGYAHPRRGYGNGNRESRGDIPRHVPHNEVQDEGEKVKKNENAEEVKEDAATGKDLVEKNANNGGTESGWDMPEGTEAVTDGKTENTNSKKTEEDRQRMESEEEEDKKMTLVEYEKLLQEKRKALEAMRNETKRVVDEKEFEGMQLVEKKEEEHFIKLKMDKEKQKKKEGTEKDEKARKSVSIKVGYYGGRGRGRGRGQRGEYRAGSRLPDAPKIEDASQFPVLGQAVKA